MSLLGIIQYVSGIKKKRTEHYLIHYFILLLIILSLKINRKLKILFCITFVIIFRKTINMWLYLCVKLYLLYKKRENMFIICKNVLSNFQIVENFKNLPNYNSILLINYPNEIFEYAALWHIPKKLSLMSIACVENFVQKHNIDFGIKTMKVKEHDFNNFEPIKKCIKDTIKDCCIAVYVNKANSRLNDHDVGVLRKGVFHIAHQLQVPVTPMVIDFVDHSNGIIKNQKFQFFVGNTTIINNPLQYRNDLRKFFKEHIKHMKETKYKI